MDRLALRACLGVLLVSVAVGCGGSDAVIGTAGGTNTGGSSGSSSGGSSGVADTTAGTGTGTTGGSADTTAAPVDSSGEASTGGEPCRIDEDCVDTNPCTEDTCSAEGCVHEELHQQPAPGIQVDGDCEVILCVLGEPVPTNNDDDLPVDMNVCTEDVCASGGPSNPPSDAGTPCNDDGTCDGNGTCSQCLSPDDCDQLPVDDDCQTRTCEDNACGQTFTAADTPVDPQVPGDCDLVVCDGAGAQVGQPDDTDILDDGLECTTDTCDNGVPESTPLAAGTPCSAGVCDGAGACVGCLVPADCGGEDSFCRTITCIAGMCGVDDEPAGTPLPGLDQSSGDCLERQCDGSGNVVELRDDVDLPPDDGNDCTGEVCEAGNPAHPDLPIDTDCSSNGGLVCDGAGQCVGCNDDTQCPAAPQCSVASCEANVCVEVVSPGVACEDGLFCTAGDTCSAGGVCQGGATPCAGPDGDSNCAETCDEAANSCGGNDPAGSACEDGLFCTTGDVCNGAGTCSGGGNPCAANVGDADNNCAESCNEGADSCTAADPNGSSCNDGQFCTLTDSCTNGVCGGTGNPCSGFLGDADTDCSESCNEVSNNCTSNDPNGSSCSDGLFCTVTDTCSNGVCGGTGNPCTAFVGDPDTDCSESCNEVTNNCTSNDPNGSACNDALFCTATDTCTNGVCGGTGNPCSGNLGDADSDCSESCNEVSNNCSSNDPNGSTCSDGLFCTATDTCSGGVCGGVGNPCPGADGDNNCSESCNEGTNNCTSNDPNNSVCSDGLFCTSNDRCQAGTCVGGANPCPGPDGDTDCSEVCNETSNNCSNDDPNGSLCDESCFVPGVCTNGGCITVCP